VGIFSIASCHNTLTTTVTTEAYFDAPSGQSLGGGGFVGDTSLRGDL
jgi:hypothetical protein